MRVRYWKNLGTPVDGMRKVSAMSWSPNGRMLAVSTAGRVVRLYDENEELKDSITIGHNEKGGKNNVVRAMAFSQDSTKLAIAHSDNVIFVYELDTEWKEKQLICNKFILRSSITCMTWPFGKPNEIYFGTAEGKVAVGTLNNNKSCSVYTSDSYVVSIASSPDEIRIASGHLDGSIVTMNLDTRVKYKIVTHFAAPYALSWGIHILAAGNDGRVVFYDPDGTCLQEIDYSKDDKVKEFTTAMFNPTGETAIVGNFNRFYVYRYNSKRLQWEEVCGKHIENYYSVTALAWKFDSSMIAFGSLGGSVDIFDIGLKKKTYKGKFEFTYVSASQVIVRSIEGGMKMMLKSELGSEIIKVNVYQDRYIIGETKDTILLGDTKTAKSSEILWRSSGNEKFIFSNPSICMIFNAGELSIVEYGVNQIIGTCRTEHVRQNMISVCLNCSQKIEYENGITTKVIAYLMDSQTVYLQDLNTQKIIVQIDHDAKIKYLKLNPQGDKLLFIDRRKRLYIYNILEQSKLTLLSFCTYANWVPCSDVVVAQNQNSLCVGYSIDEPDKPKIYDIRGDVESIEKSEGNVEVITNDGIDSYRYSLNAFLIGFRYALEHQSLESVMEILEPLELTQESEAAWKSLAKIALEQNNFFVAERSYSALGNVAKSSYYRKINELVREFGYDHYRAQDRLAGLEKQSTKTDSILTDHNLIDEAMTMFQEVHKSDANKQKVADINEGAGNYVAAINLFLKGGLPEKAANIVIAYNMPYSQDLLEKIASALISNNMHEKAGDFFQRLDLLQRAFDSYVRGRAFRKAIDLAKAAFPAEVVNLEEEWGDHLVSHNQFDVAIEHYKQAGVFVKAVDSAIKANQWNSAVQLAQDLPTAIARQFYKKIAQHYADVGQLDLAEKYFIKAEEFIEIFEMYIKDSKWNAAHKVISRYLPESEYKMLYIKEGQNFEKEGRYKEAERMYIAANEPDHAINMYKTAMLYDDIIRLVSKYREIYLIDTHNYLAQKGEADGNLKQAEQHYVEGDNWKRAVDMYTAHEMGDEAIRVIKAHGSQKDIEDMIVKVATNMNDDSGKDFLIKNGLVDAAIKFEISRNNFAEAFELANFHAQHKLPDVHLKYAFFLEDEKRYTEAEEEFIIVNKPTEAIQMYEYQKDWNSALRVARQYHPESVKAVFQAQAKFFLERRDFTKAEDCFINAQDPESAVYAYMAEKMYGEALKVAKKHVPYLIHNINTIGIDPESNGNKFNVDDIYKCAKMWEDSQDYSRAIDGYLKIAENHTNDYDFLEEVWTKAYTLAMSYSKDRLRDVAEIVCERLLNIRRYSSAAEIYENMGNYEKAVEIFINDAGFDKAKQSASKINSESEQNDLLDKIMKCEKQYKSSHSDVEDPIEINNIDGIEILYKNDKYEQCLALAAKQGENILNLYLGKYARQLIRNSNWNQAAKTLYTYKCPPDPILFAVYKAIALEILAEPDISDLIFCKKMLQKLVNNLVLNYDENNLIYVEFSEYLLINHYLLLKCKCENDPALSHIYCRLSISLLRYTKIIRADKAFLDAGNACKNEGMINMALIFLKRYLEIADAIDDLENAQIDNTDFEHTDIPSPYEIPIPESNLTSEDEREEIRDWVLEIQLDDIVKKSLDIRQCEKTCKGVYEASLINPYTNEVYKPCIVTGYPLFNQNLISCRFCHKGAVREFWNLYVNETSKCPWCESFQTPY